jgi:hypothetical protein
MFCVYFFAILEIKSRASHMLGKLSTTELPQPCVVESYKLGVAEVRVREGVFKKYP